jgi:hypothetical protein
MNGLSVLFTCGSCERFGHRSDSHKFAHHFETGTYAPLLGWKIKELM